MKKKIVAYHAPDLSGFDKRIALVEEKIDDMVILVKEAQEISRDIRTDLKDEINKQSDTIYKIDKRTSGTDREIRTLIRQSEKDSREMIKDAEDRLDLARRKLDSDMKELEGKVNKSINRALKNPLNALTQ
jgi:F0F1-type ATP synthase membrane subunit b/b'